MRPFVASSRVGAYVTDATASWNVQRKSCQVHPCSIDVFILYSVIHTQTSNVTIFSLFTGHQTTQRILHCALYVLKLWPAYLICLIIFLFFKLQVIDIQFSTNFTLLFAHQIQINRFCILILVNESSFSQVTWAILQFLSHVIIHRVFHDLWSLLQEVIS